MKDEKDHDLTRRTKHFSLAIIHLYSNLPKTTAAQILGKQLLRSATSVGAQYREANRAKSNPDFVSKIEGSLKELDETAYWLELLLESKSIGQSSITPLLEETDELISMFVSIAKSVKQKAKRV